MTATQGPPTLPPPAERARALLVDEARFDLHVAPGYHPERPERLIAARAAVRSASAHFERVPGRSATDEELARVHDPRFIDELATLSGQRRYIDPDTYVAAGSIGIARLAAGSLAAMVEAMVRGPVAKGVALLRPPGHHARPGHAMGFCLLNNVAIAAAHARSLGLARVAIVDWDVHHGNGTQEMFWSDPGVLYISTHQFPFYPGTGDADEVGDGDGRGYTVNIPLAAGGGDGVYASAFERVVLPVLDAYAPELVLVSAGFDAATPDPLAQMQVSSAAFAWMGREIARTVSVSASGRMVLVLEGGYDLVSLEAGLAGAIDGMLHGRAPEVGRAYRDEGVERAVGWAKKAWPMVK